MKKTLINIWAYDHHSVFTIEHNEDTAKSVEKAIGEVVVDLLVLNGCEDFILRHEVLKGELVFCRDADLNASFFSWTNRMYEDQQLRMERIERQIL